MLLPTFVIVFCIVYGIASLIQSSEEDKPETKPVVHRVRTVCRWDCNGWGRWNDISKPSSGDHKYVITEFWGDVASFNTLEEAKAYPTRQDGREYTIEER